jgi:hypothetical protein
MKILFTKDQYLKLLKLVYLGNWMINAIRSGAKGDEIMKEYDELEQYIFSFAKEFGFEKYIEFDKKLGKFYPTADFEDNTDVDKYKEEYDDDTFWDSLMYKLSWRDFVNKYGMETINKMSIKERIEKEQPFLDKWADEIDKHGVQRIDINQDKTN